MSAIYRAATLQKRLTYLINSRGYSITQVNGQRICGPPTNPSDGPEPGSEVFVRNLPRHIFEDELVPVFEAVGRVYQTRLMMDFRGNNRGFGFVSFYTAEEATYAVNFLNGFEIRSGYCIGVHKSVNNCRLYAGGIPDSKTREEFFGLLRDVVDGIVDVIMYSSYEDKDKNRGFAFIEFENHRMAALARRQLAQRSLVLWEVPILIDWADPIPDVDPNVMAQVTNLYLRNLGVALTTSDIWKFLRRFVNTKTVQRVYKTKDYAFVHFDSRDSAEIALETLHGKKLGDGFIEVTWARPRTYSKNYRMSNPPIFFTTSVPAQMRRKMFEGRSELSKKHESERIFSELPASQIFCGYSNKLASSSINDVIKLQDAALIKW